MTEEIAKMIDEALSALERRLLTLPPNERHALYQTMNLLRLASREAYIAIGKRAKIEA